MLDTLRRLVQEVNVAPNLERALATIVQRVRDIVQADVCSVYLLDPLTQEYVLKATEGLAPEAVENVRLAQGEGLVGLVARRAEPVNLDDAPAHPRYRFFPDTGEEHVRAFLGVPIIHHRDVVGVLVIQRQEASRFDEDIETLLITVAAQLAGAIAHAEVTGDLTALEAGADRSGEHRRVLKGQPGAPGIAIGTICVIAICMPSPTGGWTTSRPSCAPSTRRWRRCSRTSRAWPVACMTNCRPRSGRCSTCIH
jgi:phosphotransferase system enzyme I (PtsP)